MEKEQAEGGILIPSLPNEEESWEMHEQKSGIFKPEVGNMEDVDNMKEEGRST